MIYLIRSTYIQLEQNRSAFVGLPQDYRGFFFFPSKISKKVLLFLPLSFSAAQEKYQGARESGNMPMGVFIPSPLCGVFLHVLFPESQGFVLGMLRYLEAETALTADPNADVQGAAPQRCHKPLGWGPG